MWTGIRHGRRLHASGLEDRRRTGNDGRKEAVTNWQDRGCVVHQGRSDCEHFKVACNLKGTKWSWADATNNRALTTVRERATGGLLPDSTPNPATSQLASGPEQTHNEEQLIAIKAKKALLVGDIYGAVSHSRIQKAAKYPRSKKGKHGGRGAGEEGTTRV